MDFTAKTPRGDLGEISGAGDGELDGDEAHRICRDTEPSIAFFNQREEHVLALRIEPGERAWHGVHLRGKAGRA